MQRDIYFSVPQDSRFIGCFDARDQFQYALPWWSYDSQTNMTVDRCITDCKRHNFAYAGLVNSIIMKSCSSYLQGYII